MNTGQAGSVERPCHVPTASSPGSLGGFARIVLDSLADALRARDTHPPHHTVEPAQGASWIGRDHPHI